MKKPPLFRIALIASLCAAPTAQALTTLTGTVRDFCASVAPTAPPAGCTPLSDFQGPLPGVVTGMVAPTLVGGLPAPGPNLVAGGSTADNFAKWYVDSPGFNLASPITLTLTEGPPGTLSYSSNAFFPIDGQGFGNQGNSHNYHFTMQLQGLLSFTDPTPGTADSFFTFTGDDDLWIFVGGRLMLDLGGVHGAATASFSEEDLKAQGFVAGANYPIDIFFAERHTTDSNFSIVTTLNLTPIPEPAAWWMFTGGLLALALRARHR
jgi:fibro-slime domain-containing protein